MCGVKEAWKRYKRKPSTKAADLEHTHEDDQTPHDLNSEGQVLYTSKSQNTYMPDINIEDQHQTTKVPDMTQHSGSQHCMEDGLNKKATHMIPMDKISPNQIPQHNTHLYFQDEVNSYNS